MLQRLGGIGILMLGAFTGWTQSGSGVEAAVADDADVAADMQISRNRRASWLWLNPGAVTVDIGAPAGAAAAATAAAVAAAGSDGVGATAKTTVRQSRMRKLSIKVAAAVERARSFQQELPFSQLDAEQLSRIEAWLGDAGVTTLLVASTLPLSGAEAEESVVSDQARRLMQAVFRWQAAVSLRAAVALAHGAAHRAQRRRRLA
jgi:hypothetical protein